MVRFMTHRIQVTAFSKSKARVLGLPRPQAYVRGQQFTINLKFKNVEEVDFPGNETVEISIRYPTRQFEKYYYEIPFLNPGEECETGWSSPWNALSDGYALVSVFQSGGHTLINFVNPKGQTLGMDDAVHGMHIELMRDIYTFYALVATVVSLVGLTAEKIFGASWLIGFLMLLAFVFIVVVEPDP